MELQFRHFRLFRSYAARICFFHFQWPPVIMSFYHQHHHQQNTLFFFSAIVINSKFGMSQIVNPMKMGIKEAGTETI
jgi:hypothetical protein